LIVSLPKQWVDRNKVGKGDLISMDENKEGLLIRTNKEEPKKEEPRSIVINSEDKSLVHLKTEIVSAYLDNYDLIEVMSKDLKTNSPEIKKILQDLAGMEIINQSSTRIVAKDLINIKEISIVTLIRRMDTIVRSMMQDAIECFDGVDHAQSVFHIDEEVNRLHFLTYRIIRSGLKDVRIANSLGTNALKLHSDHTVTNKIERIADNTKRVCRFSNETKLDEKWRSELKRALKNIKQSYLDVMKSYYTNDVQIALKIEEDNKEIIRECDKFFVKHDHKELKFDDNIRKGVCGFRGSCGATAKIIENMKEMASCVRYIARTIIGGG